MRAESGKRKAPAPAKALAPAKAPAPAKWQPVDARHWMTEWAWNLLATCIGREPSRLREENIKRVAQCGSLLWGERIDAARTREEFTTYLKEAAQFSDEDVTRAIYEVELMTKRRTGR